MNHLISVGLIYTKDNKLLCVKSKGKDKFFIPGGKPELKESNESALKREVQEELNVKLDLNSIKYQFTINDIAYGLKDTTLDMHCYRGDFNGNFIASSEIETASWLSLSDIALCAPAAQKVMKRILKSENNHE